MRVINRCPLGFAVVLLLSAPVSRAAEPTSTAVTLDRVQVVGTQDAARAPVAASVVQADARRAGELGLALSDLLSGVPGVLARTRQNWAQDEQLSIRGVGTRSAFGLRGMRLYLDGIPATMPDGQGQVSHFHPADLARVEVLRGPFSALYGNASGGVVQAWTADGRALPGLSLGAAVGADGQQRVSLGWGHFDSDTDQRIAATFARTDGYREHSSAQRAVLTAKTRFALTAQTQLDLVANLFDAPDAQDPQGLTRAQANSAPAQASPSALLFNTRKSARQAQAGAVLESDFDAGSLRVATYAGVRQVRQFLSTPVATQRNPLNAGGVVELRAPFAGVDARWSAGTTWWGAPVDWAAGLDAQWQQQDRAGYENFIGSTLGVRGALRLRQDDRVRSLDPYLQLHWQPRDSLDLMAGVRRSEVRFASHDRYITATNPDDSGATRFSAVTPVLGASLRVAPAVHAYAAYGAGIETPTGNELAYRGDGGSGPNLALRAARSHSLEAGLKFAGMRARWDVAAFDSRTDDELTAATSAGGRTTFQNGGRAHRRGLELDGALQWGDAWDVRMSAGWLDARFDTAFLTCASAPCPQPDTPVAAGTRIPGTAARMGNLSLRRGGDVGWRAQADLQYVGPVHVSQTSAEVAAGYTVLGVEGGYGWRNAHGVGRVYAGVGNLADRAYIGSVIVNESNQRYYEPAPGRHAELGLEWRWGD